MCKASRKADTSETLRTSILPSIQYSLLGTYSSETSWARFNTTPKTKATGARGMFDHLAFFIIPPLENDRTIRWSLVDFTFLFLFPCTVILPSLFRRWSMNESKTKFLCRRMAVRSTLYGIIVASWIMSLTHFVDVFFFLLFIFID